MMQAAGWLENPMKEKRLAIRSHLTRKVSMPSSAQ